jgi:hypothetical protein
MNIKEVGIVDTTFMMVVSIDIPMCPLMQYAQKINAIANLLVSMYIIIS